MDLQKLDFETKQPSYLNNEWKDGGWWYYYLFALLYKVPLGTWLIVLTAAVATIVAGDREQEEGWKLFVLLAPAAAVFALVSQETGFSRYLRYVLPCFPFVFIFAGGALRLARGGSTKAFLWVAACMAYSIGSSLWIYPHSMSYFNELAGGPSGGHKHLLDANIDWGQDLIYFKEWYDQNPEANPLFTGIYSMIQPSWLSIDSVQLGRETYRGFNRSRSLRPGWYAISVHLLHKKDSPFSHFRRFEPTAVIGYTIHIFHITSDDANECRRELGLSPLSQETLSDQPR